MEDSPTLPTLFPSWSLQKDPEGQCREWSALDHTVGPMAESPLSQGPGGRG